MAIDAVLLRFLQGLILSPGDKQLSAVARRCSEEFRIGRRVGRRFLYGESDVADAIAMLESHGLPLTDTDIHDRGDAAARPGITEKHSTKGPHDDSIAYRLFSFGKPQFMGYGVGTAQEVLQVAADMMMVVENFETFRQLHRYVWVMERLKSFPSCLVVFRGDTIYSVGDALRCVNASELPKLGFHDFDPAGLLMSANLPGITEHLMPLQPELERAVMNGKRSDLYFSQLGQYAAILDKARMANIQEAWQIMKRLQKGLPQEWMRDLCCTCAPTADRL